MLYLVRKLEESIVINNNIFVKVIELRRNSVKIGIDFPRNVTVLRKEIHDRVMKENEMANSVNFDVLLELPIAAHSEDAVTDSIQTAAKLAVTQTQGCEPQNNENLGKF